MTNVHVTVWDETSAQRSRYRLPSPRASMTADMFPHARAFW